MVELIQSFAIVFFLLLIISARLSKRSSQGGPGKSHFHHMWLVGSLLVLGCSAVTVLAIDPRGYFYPNGLLPPRSSPSRQESVTNIANLPYAPDIVVLGSSRARNIMDVHAQSATGLRLYNAALNNGMLAEAVVTMDLLADQVDVPFPPVLLVEMIPGIAGRWSSSSPLWPLSVSSYLPPNVVLDGIASRLRAPFSLSNVSEALTAVLRHASGTETVQDKPDEPDIAAHRFVNIYPQAEFDEIIAGNSRWARNAEFCTDVDAELVPVLANIIARAQAQQSHVIFYISPYQPTVYRDGFSQNAGYLACRTVYNDYMNSLSQANSHVHFLDMTQPPGFSAFNTPEHYYDFWHFNPATGAWLIEQMAPTITQAYQDALAWREGD